MGIYLEAEISARKTKEIKNVRSRVSHSQKVKIEFIRY